jgi:hypothetical protein
MMKLQELKAKTWETWLMLQKFACVVVQSENFQPEVRTYGDLRCRDTWKRALGNFLALSIARSVLEPVSLVTFYLNPPIDDWTWEIRYETFEAFVRIPGGLDAVREGLTQILGKSATTYGDNLDGIFELVERSTRIRGLRAGN